MKNISQKRNRIAIALCLALTLVAAPIAALADESSLLSAGVANALKLDNNDLSLEDLGAGVHAALLDRNEDEAQGLEPVVADDKTIPTDEILLTDGQQAPAEGELETIETDVEVPADIANIEEQKPAIVMANVEDAVNVREEPNEEAAVVGKLYSGCGGDLLERRDGWTKLKSGDLEGWTKDEFLYFDEEADAASKEAGTLLATVNTSGLKLRMESSLDAGVIDMLEEGAELRAVEDLGDWVSVKYDGEVGFVAREFVDLEFSIPTGKTVEQIQAEEKAKAEKEAAEQAAKKSKEGKKKASTSNRGAVDTGASDVALLAALIQCEAGRESYDGQLAVGAVVMNRVRSGSYPNSISGVITAPAQFPPATNGKVAAVLAAGPSASCMQAAQAAISGQSNVGGATHFSTSGSGIAIGNHIFW